DIEVVYLLGADELDMTALEKAFVIYQGHHGDRGAHGADVILPGAAYTEKEATFINTEGRVQQTHLAIEPPGMARPDWKILRALQQVLGLKTRYNTLEALRGCLIEANPIFGRLDHLTPASWGGFGLSGEIKAPALAYPIINFYMTDPISRASETMAQCSEAFGLVQARKTGTDG
ncbi:MAG: molybdopterin-dependent oxidoreductase, partial [Rhodospirillaceae bacterium]|nr:molybdopterin-dependent oxidoreductase [Rhodospirillaceae bacterium]